MKSVLREKVRNRAATVLLGLLFVCLFAFPGQAAEFWLRAEATTLTMPDTTVVPMWGYVLDADNNFNTVEGNVQIPGPDLEVPPGETLIIHLKNNLPEPTSIVIPGQVPDSSVPVRFTSGPYAGRIRSFTAEAAENGGEQTYTWSNLKHGTYIYESGTHISIQVPMGLYGMMKKNLNANTGAAYPQIVPDVDARVFFSEIDPAQHNAVANGTYGTAAYTGTLSVGYHPDYFLINGVPYSAASPPPTLPVALGQKVLLRFLNTGSRTRVPALLNGYMQIIAEDGKLRPAFFDQYSLDLAPGKTMDVLVEPTALGKMAIFDRSMGLTNAGVSNGGMIAFMEVAAAGAVKVLSPNGGEQVASGSYLTTEWVAPPTSVTNRLFYSLNNGSTWTLLTSLPGTATSYNWKIPTVAENVTTAKFRVRAFDGGNALIGFDQSDSAFTILAPFRLVAPNGGEVLTSGLVTQIRWNAAIGATRYRLLYSTNSGTTWTKIADVGDVTSYDWTVPVANSATVYVMVRAYDSLGTTLKQDRSDALLTIQP